MKTNKIKANLVEKAMLVMLGERPIEDTTLQRMFDRCIGKPKAVKLGVDSIRRDKTTEKIQIK